MAGLRPMLIGIMVVLLFAVAMLSFMIGFIQLNNPNSNIFDAKYGLNSSLNSLNHSISEFEKTGKAAQEIMNGAQASPVQYVFLIFKQAFDIPISFLGTAISSFGAIMGFIFAGIGGTAGLGSLFLVFAVINTAIIITVIFLIIKAIRSGETER